MIMSGAFHDRRTPKHRGNMDDMTDEAMLGDTSYLSLHPASEQGEAYDHEGGCQRR
jgi:hypothetical protein